LGERLWRSIKWEEVYLNDYETAPEAVERLGRTFSFTTMIGSISLLDRGLRIRSIWRGDLKDEIANDGSL